MENAEIAALFDEVADLLELQGDNAFRIRSYRNAARTIRDLARPLADMVADGADLTEIPNIGDRIAVKIADALKIGTFKRLEELRREVPPALRQLMQIPGVGPRKAMELHRELGIESLDDLRRACEAHKVRELEGLGAKSEEKILAGLRTAATAAGLARKEGRAQHRDHRRTAPEAAPLIPEGDGS